MNTPGGSNVTTAEHAITLLLALARNLPQAAAATRAGRWERNRRLGTEVCNKVLGVIGLGNIGTVVAERALGLRMKVIASDPFVTVETAARLRVELVSLDELYVRSDFITIHTPLTAETRHLVNRDTLARMKRGVRLVNCARGGIVDEAALAEAIRGGHVAGAALDVLAEKLGALHAQLIAEPPLEIAVQASGVAAERETRSLTAAVLRGLLGHRLESVVNYVNAPAIARERGIRVVESRTLEASDYVNALSVQVRTTSRTTAVEGAVFGASTVRLTKVDGVRMEAVPEGHILMLHN